MPPLPVHVHVTSHLCIARYNRSAKIYVASRVMLSNLPALFVPSQFLWDGGLPCPGDDPASAVRSVSGFLAVRVLCVRALCRAITVLVAS